MVKFLFIQKSAQKIERTKLFIITHFAKFCYICSQNCQLQMEKTFSNEYRVTHKDTDINGEISLASLGNFILDTAGMHAIDLKTSIDILNQKNLTWVVTGIHFEIKRLPKINSNIKVTTKITELSRLACKRDFIVEQNGETIAGVSTEWLIINRSTRRPTFITDVLPQIQDIVSGDAQVEKYKHLRFAIDNPDSVHNHTVRYSDIDINRHLYSMRYIEMAMDMAGIEIHDTKKLVAADVNYMSEVLYNQEVTLYSKQEGDITMIEMQNHDKKPMFRAEFVWEDK